LSRAGAGRKSRQLRVGDEFVAEAFLSRVIYFLLALVVGAVGLAFHLRNRQAVELDYFVGRFATDLSLVMVGCLIVGVLLGAAAVATRIWQLKRDLRRAQRREQSVRNELAQARGNQHVG
jgi:uncharacterized integral membrane protein